MFILDSHVKDISLMYIILSLESSFFWTAEWEGLSVDIDTFH